MGRSFKYHRPRGVLSAGPEEPNALVELRKGARQEPNTRATVAELFEGLEAVSQNRWPSLAFDALAVNDLFAPLLTAGFYYKTFMWPKSFWEKVYEPAIRKAAGLGALSMEADPDGYDRAFLHTDLLVIGSGAAGLSAALTAARAGAQVVLAEEDARLGGRLLAERQHLDGAPAIDWVNAVEAELRALSNVRFLTRTAVFGAYDHGVYGAVERVSDHLADPSPVRQTLWRITARRAILAAGALERPIAFRDNDRPGIMLAGAMRAYLNRWAVAPEGRVAIFTCCDDGHRTAVDLVARGVPVFAVIDARSDAPRFGDYHVMAGAQVTGTLGRRALRAIEVTAADGRATWYECNALAVAGGWSPALHLSAHHRGKPTWDDTIQAFVPGAGGPVGLQAAGAAMGRAGLASALADGAQAAAGALADLGLAAPKVDLPVCEDLAQAISPLWHVPGKGRAWVDFQNDVTVKDIKLAHQENMVSVEHLKRWTTLGMATDQGKTGNVIGLAVMAEMTGQSIPDTGTTVYRPPYTPVSLGVLGGGDSGPHFRPTRLPPTHHWAEAQGAVFVEAGQWMRAQYFPQAGETQWRQSVDREALAVRRDVGLCDVTTLGKIDVQGADAGAFLDRIYSNTMSTLKVGRVRYGLMLREDGMLYDDGTCARMGEDHYVVTTTTANAGLVYRNMEFARQGLFGEMDVQIVSTTDAWAQIAVAGPKSRSLLERIVEADLSNDAFPFMACAPVRLTGGLRARLFRISFSGELAYELAVPARYGAAVMARLMDLGADLGVTPYGTEALGVLRVEKGHATGAELTGQTTAAMLGLGRMVSAKKDAIGAVMSRRAALEGETQRLVGLLPVDSADTVVPGAHLFGQGVAHTMETDEGWITSACHSPHLESSIGLGYLKDGDQRMDEVIVAANPLEGGEIRVKVVSAHFVDPEGARLRG
ncbi:MAG: sarcosine oxidase subunit alpha family protein [Pseudomonadota bacterium]